MIEGEIKLLPGFIKELSEGLDDDTINRIISTEKTKKDAFSFVYDYGFYRCYFGDCGIGEQRRMLIVTNIFIPRRKRGVKSLAKMLENIETFAREVPYRVRNIVLTFGASGGEQNFRQAVAMRRFGYKSVEVSAIKDV